MIGSSVDGYVANVALHITLAPLAQAALTFQRCSVATAHCPNVSHQMVLFVEDLSLENSGPELTNILYFSQTCIIVR